MTRLGEAAEQAARSTGLPKATCMTLLEEGWTLEVRMNQPNRWVDPSASLPARGGWPTLPPPLEIAIDTEVAAVDVERNISTVRYTLRGVQ